MSDLGVFNVQKSLIPILTNLKTLSQVKVGEIVVVDENGNWTLTTCSAWKSGIRKLWSLISGTHVHPQRQSFLKSAEEKIQASTSLIRLLFESVLVNKTLNKQGSMSADLIRSLDSHPEREKIEQILQCATEVCKALYLAFHGIRVIRNHAPYHTDSQFCSEIDINLQKPILDFLQYVGRKVGPEFQKHVLPVSSQEIVRLRNELNEAPLSNTQKTYYGSVSSASDVVATSSATTTPMENLYASSSDMKKMDHEKDSKSKDSKQK